MLIARGARIRWGIHGWRVVSKIFFVHAPSVILIVYNDEYQTEVNRIKHFISFI